MRSAIADLGKALDKTSVTSFGEAVVLFEPTAARCSSSSSTCCIGCIEF